MFFRKGRCTTTRYNYDKYKSVLPQWGPYSKKYMGISHVVDKDHKKGIRFDCVVHPTIANSNVPVPNVTVPSNYHPWNAKPDLSFYEYRYDLEWKDRVYADVSFLKLTENASVIRVEYHNNTELSQNCMLNYFCSLEYPSLQRSRVGLPKHHVCIDACDYTEFEYKNSRPWDEQNPDGLKKGEFLDPSFLNGRGLGDRIDASHVPQLHFLPFGAEAGDRVLYRFDVSKPFADAVLTIRYRCPRPKGNTAFRLAGAVQASITFGADTALHTANVEIGAVSAGSQTLEFISEGGAGVELDCLILTEKEDAGSIVFDTTPYNNLPEIQEKGQTIYYRYPEIDQIYGLRVFSDHIRRRRIETGCLEDAMISRLSNPDITFDDVTEPFTRSFSRKHSDDGFYSNTIIHSIFIEPHKTHVEYAVVFTGSCPDISAEECEALYQKRLKETPALDFSAHGKQFEFSNRLLRSTLLVNTVYPIYRHGSYIIHHTPGKRWDSLYTWDSGFIGLGLLESEPKLAEYILDTYLSDEENPDFAFLHHGSPVPVQSYLYLELLNRTNDKTSLYTYYDRARLYYEYLAGRAHHSTTARFKSGLTSTYDLFYSSSGMDDYPAQVYTHQHALERSVAPAISSSQVIRFAKILRMIALHCGREQDVAVYDADIARITKGLQDYSWDEDCGYFSYVVHNEQGEPTGILRNEQGENLNKGFDGVYPLVAGVCTEHQKNILLEHLKSTKNLFSKVGLSAVDMSSSYFQDNGYWNGSVWFSHQWFFFKTMLDLGETDFAFKIADTALRSWKREVDASYNCFEMLNIATGRGGWFHQFGGLSAPINIWANAYYKKGTVTAGLDTWIAKRDFAPDYSGCSIDFEYHGNGHYSIIVVLSDDEKKHYQASLNGEPVAYKERFKGVLEFTFDKNCKGGNLSVW